MFGLLTYRLAKLLTTSRAKEAGQESKGPSSSAAVLRLYHLLNDLISVPPLIFLKIAKVLWPRLSSHWIFVVKKSTVAKT
jgi:hypothetical protein